MKPRQSYISLLLIALCFALNAQEKTDLLTVESITFSGNENTNLSFLKKVIACQEGMPLDPNLLELDIQNLKNLPSVIEAHAHVDTADTSLRLSFTIKERKTILPIVNLGTIRTNFWFALGASENNLRGRGDKLFAYYQNNDGRHAGQIQLEKFRIRHSSWGAGLNVYHWSSIEPLYFEEGPVDYNYDNTGVGTGLIKNFSVRRNVLFGLTLFREGYTQRADQILTKPPGPEQFTIDKLLSKIQWNQNELNYHFFYLTGYAFNLTYQNVYSFNQPTPFNSFECRLKVFYMPDKKSKINLAGRFVFGMSTNDNSPFAPFVADSHVNLRGVGNRIDRGTGQLVLNGEVRYTLEHENNWAAQAVVFTDFGTWRSPGGSLADFFDVRQFRQFVGLGARVMYLKIYGATFRIDYGIDIYNFRQQGFVLGLGQYF